MQQWIIDRRRVLLGLGAACSGRGQAFVADARTTDPAFTDYPFRLGVASGSATHEAIVLWTRLAPSPLAPLGGMPPRPFAVHWVMSLAPDLSRPVASGTVLTHPRSAHAVHVDVRHLAPATRYWYRFVVAGIASPIGATRTLPADDATVREARFATLCCQNYAHGYFTAYDALVEDEPDFVVHLGDYIYETGFGRHVREHETAAPLATLEAWRHRHALYKMDPSLARAHAALPFFVIPDNHDAVDDASPSAHAARIHAYQAWMEHMPVRDFLIGPGRARIGRSVRIGKLMQMELLDTRQYRDRQDVCAESAGAAWGFGNYRIPCRSMLEPRRTMLGARQEAGLRNAFPPGGQTWNVLVSTVPFAPFLIADPGHDRSYTASWNGYPAARQRMIRTLRNSGSGSTIVLSGDIHSSWIMDLRETFDNPNSAFGTEITATSITADCPLPLAGPLKSSVSHNPHVRYHDVERHGYVLHSVSHGQWCAELKFVDDVRIAGSTTKTAKTVRIPAGGAIAHDIA